jgi:hypothetical protein
MASAKSRVPESERMSLPATPMILHLRRELPTPSLAVFVLLQLVDILTTLLGLRMGAREGSVFIGRLMQVGPMAGLLISKMLAVCLVGMALRWHRPRVVVMLNYWSAIVVAWNLFAIYSTVLLH